MEDKTVFTVKNNRVLPISINAEWPVFNRKATYEEMNIYVGLAVRSYNSRDYLVAEKWYSKNTAPKGAVVHFYYRTGSHKHAYFVFDKFFVVSEGRWEIKTKYDNKEIVVTLENLKPVEISESDLKKAEAEIYNRGWRPSQYDPVRTLYHLWIMRRAHEEARKEEEKREEKTEKEERKEEERKDLESILAKYSFLLEAAEVEQPSPPPASLPAPVSLPATLPKEGAIEEQRPSAEPREAAQPADGQPPAEAQPLSTTSVQPAEEAPQQSAAEERLVPLWFVVFDLPSWSLATVRREAEHGHETVRYTEELDREAKAKLETLRRRFYSLLEEVAVRTPYGWIATTEESARRIEAMANEYERAVRAITTKNAVIAEKLRNANVVLHVFRAYLDVETAWRIVSTMKTSLNSEIQELAKEIEALKKQQVTQEIKRKLATLEKKLALAKQKLEEVLKYEERWLSGLPRLPA